MHNKTKLFQIFYQINRGFQHGANAIDIFVMRAMLVHVVVAVSGDLADMRRRFNQVLTGRVVFELVDQDLNDLIFLLTVDNRIEQKVLLGSKLGQLSFQQRKILVLRKPKQYKS